MPRKWMLLVVGLGILVTVLLVAKPPGRSSSPPKLTTGSSDAWKTRLTSDSPEEAEAARQELIAAGPEALPVLRSLLKTDTSDSWVAGQLHLLVLEVLSEIGPPAVDAWPDVVTLLDSEDELVRCLAATTVPAIGTSAKDAVSPLTVLFERDRSVPVARALSEYQQQAAPAIPILVAVLGDPQLDTETRWNAARALGKIREAAVEAIPALVAHLRDQEPTVREHAAEALGDIGHLASYTAADLINVLNDDYVKVRRDAARSLGQINADPEIAIPALKPLLNDNEEIVRDAAQAAIKAIESK